MEGLASLPTSRWAKKKFGAFHANIIRDKNSTIVRHGVYIAMFVICILIIIV
jgi:hypothetical protein